MHRCLPPALGLAALLFALPASAEPDARSTGAEPLAVAELHGRRAIALRGGVRVRWFDHERPPMVEVGPLRAPSLVWLDPTGAPVRLPHRVEVAHGMTYLVTEAEPPPGAGLLGLFDGWHLEASWAVEWRAPPERDPAVAELARLRARLAEARAYAAWRRSVSAAMRAPLLRPDAPPAEQVVLAPLAEQPTGHPDPEVRVAEREVEQRRRWLATRAEALADPDGADAARLWLSVERARATIDAAPPGSPAVLRSAERAWVAAADVARRLSVVSEHARRSCAAAFMAMDAADYSAADGYIQQATVSAGDDAASRALVAHVAGVLERRTGGWRAAEALFADGALAAARAREDRLLPFLRQSRALLALDLGDHQRAVELIAPLIEDSTLRPLQRARVANNGGYILFRAMGAGAITVDLDRVRHLFDQAELLSDQVDTAAHLQVNRALVELHAGRLDAAARQLARIRPDAAGTEVAAAVELVQGRLAMAQSRLEEAERHFSAADRAAVRGWGPGGGDYGWRADLGRGQVARARGEPTRAQRHFARSRDRLERLAAFTDPLAQRVAFFADRDDLARLSLDVALELDALEEAFTLADRNQARMLRSMMWAAQRPGPDDPGRAPWTALQGRIAVASDALRAVRRRGEVLAPAERKPWALELRAAEKALEQAVDAAVAFLDAQLQHLESRTPADVRRALGPGQTILVIGRSPQGRVALWAHADGYQQSPLPPAPLTALPTPPWPTTHLYVVAGGQRDVVQRAFAEVDRPWSVSLLPVAELLATRPRQPSAPPVILADPTSDLPAAREEGRRLHAALPGARLGLQGEATRARFKHALQTARLVHFAGHGELDPAQPWSTHLVLAGGACFDVFDVLSTTAGGGLAVLNGCETGADVLSTREDVLGLPEALMVAGASAVVAASVKLPEADAARFTTLFYAHGGLRRPGPALRATMRQLRDEGVGTWSAWRLVGRPILPDPDEETR